MVTITRTVTDVVTTSVFSTIQPTSTDRAPSQGGILEGGNPTHYDKNHPIIIFIIQAGIILLVCRALHYPLALLRQPRVIAEVLGGILLGPSVIGRIPGFTDAIFPEESLPNLNLVANLGLVLFLFIIGLEVDLRYFVSNWKVALSVGVAGMTLPFAIGAALSYGLYEEFGHSSDVKPVPFGVYLLFVGIAMAITAFPVLCRILTELKLMQTPVGVIVLAAGVGNDVIGWVLLALCVALVNAGSGLTALYVILVCAAYTLFLTFAVRPVFMWILRRSHSLQDGPSSGVMVLTVIMCLTSAFFTGVIGVHPIFGAFLAGLICPHEGGFAIKVTEKIEDLMAALFLPLYFTLSGLSTNLGLLNSGTVWGYVFAVTIVAWSTKFAGCSVAARLNGMVWRESFTIGSLMSCKGLVELIVLNIGLQAKILSVQVFTIFVVMALVTTFATTPMASYLYPPWYQKKLRAWKRGDIDWDTGALLRDGRESFEMHPQKGRSSRIESLLIYLRLDNMPNLLAFVSLFATKPSDSDGTTHPQHDQNKPSDRDSSLESTSEAASPGKRRSLTQVYGMRLMQLTARGSAVMKVAEADELSAFDPVLNAFRVLGQLYSLIMHGEVAVVPENAFADSLTTKATEELSDLLLIPWSETGSISESNMVSEDVMQRKLAIESAYSSFVAEAFNTAPCSVAVFVNKGFGGSLKQRPTPLNRQVTEKSARAPVRFSELPKTDKSHHIFMPYFGGSDGRTALRLVLQLAENPEITATVIHYQIKSEIDETASQRRLMPELEKVRVSTSSDESDDVFFATMQRSLSHELRPRVRFGTHISFDPVQDAVASAHTEVGRNQRNGGDIVMLSRNVEMAQMQTSSCLGLVADIMLERDIKASLVIVQAGLERPNTS